MSNYLIYQASASDKLYLNYIDTEDLVVAKGGYKKCDMFKGSNGFYYECTEAEEFCHR
jgi:hypothetical protein